MGLLTDLVDAKNATGLAFLHKAFLVALDDFTEHRDDAPTLNDSVVVAGALAIMARLDPEAIDPVRLIDDDRDDLAMLLVTRARAYAPLFQQKAPNLSPWFDALATAGPQIEAARDGDSVAAFDLDWLERLAPTAFRYPATRRYLSEFFTEVLAALDPAVEPTGALWICLRFRRWFTLSPRQRSTLRRHVLRWPKSERHAAMSAALRKLETPEPVAAH